MDNNKNLQLIGDVVHITSDEHSLNWMYERDAKKISKDIQIVSIEAIPALTGTNVALPNRRLHEGDILIRHPYEPNMYIDALNAAYEIRISKYALISEIAQKLGAVSYVITEAIEEIEERTWDVKAGFSYRIVKASGSIKNDNELRRAMGIKINDTFPPRTISPQSHQDAIEFAKQYNLWSDGFIRSLIRKRAPQDNPLSNETLHIDVTKEANSRLDAAFSLNVLGGVFNLDASLNNALSQRETISLDITFIFPN